MRDRDLDDFSSPLANAPALPILIYCSLFLLFTISLSIPFGRSVAAALSAAVGWCAIGTSRYAPRSVRILAALVVTCGVCTYILSEQTHITKYQDQTINIECRVESSRKWGYGSALLVTMQSGAWIDKRALISLRSNEEDISPGDVIKVYGRVAHFQRARETESFDEMLYWRAKGAELKIEATAWTKIGRVSSLAALRADIAERIRDSLPPLCSAYLLAAITGEKDDRISDLHRTAGTSHLLAVSGFHVGIVFAIGWLLFRYVRCRLIFISIMIWAYVLISGAAPSAMRAAAMVQLLILGKMFGMPGRSLNTACAAGVLMLLADPWLFWDIGWRLSMLAVLIITSTSDLDIGTMRVPFISAAVWLVTSAQSAHTFGTSPLSGLILNMIAIPIFTVLYPAAAIMSLPAMIGLDIGRYIASMPEAIFAMWERLSLNVIYLFPQDINFSFVLFASAAALMAMSAARASGFDSYRCAAVTAAASLAAAAMF